MNIDRQGIQRIVEEVLQSVDHGVAKRPGPRTEMGPRVADEQSATVPTRGGDGTPHRGTRIIVTALGRNAPGIAAGITGALSEARCDVLDMSQTLLGEFFAMVVVVDISQASSDFGIIKEGLMERGASLGVRVICQHEDVFRSMHRI